MANKMLIDAAHPEETRVVVVRGNRVEEFDFEAANRKQLRGNIYLAKVTRVEPSLQAAFVEYGGNRHGFLAFSEIHPDYYQIPVADREALLAAEAAERDQDDQEPEPKPKRRRRSRAARNESKNDVVTSDPVDAGSEQPNEALARGDANLDEGTAPNEGGEQSAPDTEASDDSAIATENPAGESDTPDAAEQPENASEAESGDAQAPDDANAAEAVDADAETAAAESSTEDGKLGEAADSGETEGASEGPAHSDDEAGSSGQAAALETEDAASDAEDETSAGEDGDEDEASDNDDSEDDDDVESVGAEDAMEEVPVRRQQLRKQYKIQEVIKRRQIILVQVVKEERGNKGAALTTYLSLAGRYSVLMPNTARGGGISRKITQPTDRKRLKAIASELEVPEGMGVILRTAGASRTKAEIKRDFEYLMRLWENVRELTLRSSAPSLVYEEGSLVKRSIRDLYNKDIDEVLVSGEDSYREAKDFMRMLMPSHAKNVQPYRDPSPVFIRYGVEPQLDAMFSPQVTLKSGGYIVINQTEALVSIDVNSGKSTREHNIEDTALQTNLEAAEEVTRQLRLRDLAGLIVIDFIDMEENKNNRAVERKLKECLKNDRARIQVGRISHFGLLEMSRQRIRTGVLESSTTPCPHCQGTGMIRSTESVALHVLRSLEDNLLKGASHNVVIRTSTTAALYILNNKRSSLYDLEHRFGVDIEIQAEHMENGQLYALERGEPASRAPQPNAFSPIVQPDMIEMEEEQEEQPDFSDTEETGADRKRKRRRRRRRGGNDNQPENADLQEAEASGSDGTDASDDDDGRSDTDGDGEQRRKRRRGRRGGRRGRRGQDENGFQADGEGEEALEGADNADAEPSDSEGRTDELVAEPIAAEAAAETEGEAPDTADAAEVPDAEVGTGASAEPAAEETPVEEHAAADAQSEEATEEPESEEPVEPAKPSAPVEPVVTSDVSSEAEDKPKRAGWWQRGRSFF